MFSEKWELLVKKTFLVLINQNTKTRGIVAIEIEIEIEIEMAIGALLTLLTLIHLRRAYQPVGPKNQLL